MTAPQDAAERRDALVGRLFEATLGARPADDPPRAELASTGRWPSAVR
jgi:hypothetical protein